jgi:hypothetical protein
MFVGGLVAGLAVSRLLRTPDIKLPGPRQVQYLLLHIFSQLDLCYRRNTLNNKLHVRLSAACVCSHALQAVQEVDLPRVIGFGDSVTQYAFDGLRQGWLAQVYLENPSGCTHMLVYV